MELKWHLHMSLTLFEKLLSFIRTSLKVIIPEIALYCTLRYLAGGSYMDIFLLVYPNLRSTMLYGRQCMPLPDAKTNELCGQIPKN